MGSNLRKSINKSIEDEIVLLIQQIEGNPSVYETENIEIDDKGAILEEGNLCQCLVFLGKFLARR